jgi:hypothetical protein
MAKPRQNTQRDSHLKQMVLRFIDKCRRSEKLIVGVLSRGSRSGSPMQMLFDRVRAVVFIAGAVFLFIVSIVAVSINVAYGSVYDVTLWKITVGSQTFDLDNVSTSKSECAFALSLVKAGRAFVILTILLSVPILLIGVVDLLRLHRMLGAAIAPLFRFIMAGVAGLPCLTALIAWPILTSLASNLNSCLGPTVLAPAGSPFVMLIGWLFSCGLVAAAVFAPGPPPDPSRTEPEKQHDAVASEQV